MGDTTRQSDSFEQWPENNVMGPAREYASHSILFRQNEAADTLYLIEVGVVKLVRSERNGRDLLIALRTSRWLLGASSTMLGLPHPVTAETIAPCRLRQIRASDFLLIQRTNLAVTRWVQRMQARETYEQVDLLGIIGTQRPSRRLERLLRRLLHAHHELRPDGSVRLTMNLKQDEVAQAIGISREHANRLLRRFESLSLIRREKGWLIAPSGSPLLASEVAPD